jgi:endonuclease-3
MDLFGNSTDWTEKLKPILTKYKGQKHPLEYHNLYQLMVMVVLSAQDSDANINKIAPALFDAYPNMVSLAVANEEALFPYISEVRNFGTKAKWLLEIAKTVQNDANIPLTMEGLVALKGIGRKSAHVIKAEKQLMQVLPKEIWGEIGMAISFLGREICRPQPKCPECPINSICQYYKKIKG